MVIMLDVFVYVNLLIASIGVWYVQNTVQSGFKRLFYDSLKIWWKYVVVVQKITFSLHSALKTNAIFM